LYENEGEQFLNGDMVLVCVRGMKLVGQVTKTYHVQLVKAFRSVPSSVHFRKEHIDYLCKQDCNLIYNLIIALTSNANTPMLELQNRFSTDRVVIVENCKLIP